MDQTEKALGRPGSLKNIIVVAEALHAQTEHARDLAGRGAALFIRVKGKSKATRRPCTNS